MNGACKAVSIGSSVLPIYFKELYQSSIISSILFDLIWTWNGILTRLLSYDSKAAGTDLRLTASISVNLLRIWSSDKKVLLVSLCQLVDSPEPEIQIFRSDSAFRFDSKEPIHYKVQEQVNNGRAALMTMKSANLIDRILTYDSALSI